MSHKVHKASKMLTKDEEAEITKLATMDPELEKVCVPNSEYIYLKTDDAIYN